MSRVVTETKQCWECNQREATKGGLCQECYASQREEMLRAIHADMLQQMRCGVDPREVASAYGLAEFSREEARA